MVLDLLYRYITHPKQCMAYAGSLPVMFPSVVILMLLGCSMVESAVSFGDLLLQGIGVAMVLFFFYLFLSLFWDFVAQLLGKPGQSRGLFLFVLLSLLPIVLWVPLSSLSVLPGVANVLSLVDLLIFIGVVYLQITTLREIYGLTISQGILVYFSPIVVPVGAFILFGTLAGVLL